MSRHFVLSMHLLIGSVVISVASMTLVVRKGGYPWLSRKVAQLLHRQPPAPNNRISLFEQLTIESEDIVFLGDSILNSGEWNELLKCNRAKNRAIGGDDTHTILARLKPIIEAGPRHVVLHCGINNFQKGIPFAQTTAEYREIVSSLQSPHTDLWLIPVFPVNAYLYQRWVVADHPEVTRPRQSEVEALNRFIKSLASDNPSVHFVEMQEMLNMEGELSPEFTYDGLHLNGRGLKQLAARLQQLKITTATIRRSKKAA